ncbi:hypothetical protein [Nocardia acidivorans]|uniref:hypothetical protein n=1 Tax=Nocardia acidivorans TaxID=404580 RepID=UPI00082AEC89|nr:hypothetical protein [Nocardia acidivorans]
MIGWWRREHDSGEFGLLVRAATVPDLRAARTVRQLLYAYGVRATTGRSRPPRYRATRDRLHILVFPEDAVRAYDVLRRHTR